MALEEPEDIAPLSLRRALEINTVDHVVVTIRNGLGDAVLALPLIRFIASLCGYDRLLIWGRRSYAETVFEEFSNIFLPVNDGWLSESTSESQTEITQLRRRIPEQARVAWVSLNSYSMVASEMRAIAVIRPHKVWRYHPAVWRDAGGPLIRRSDQYFRVIGESHMNMEFDMKPSLDTGALREGEYYRNLGKHSSRGLLVIHTEASKADKRWPLNYWELLINDLRDRFQVVAVGHADQDIYSVESIVRPESRRWLTQVGIVSAADLFIGIDSCFAHVADSFYVPGCVLFGPTSINQWGPRSECLVPLIAPEQDLEHLSPDLVFKASMLQFSRWRRRSEGNVIS
jgi:Glycosyltransferase family 9 (heptosyltransferase)